ncbi:PAAR domain-containing protein [Pseudomonas japonica]|uniref:PAAR domain-containing protein n=1 Tax=Pseudomonas japonica TaxID=256466 RepID=UPI003825E1CD
MTRSTFNGLGQGLHGDETTTGAVCYSSLPNSTQGNRGVLRVGDKTSKCPRCGQQGSIVEGWAGFKWHGAPTALHGAQVQCGCPAGSNRLIAQDPPARSTRMASPAAVAATARTTPPTPPDPTAFPIAPASPFSTEQDDEPAEPGFYIVPQSISRQQLVAELFGDAPSSEVMRKFNGLNGSLGDGIVKAGQLVVLADPRNYMCMREEAHLMGVAEEVGVALADLTPEDADFMSKYHGDIASFLGSTSTWAGVTMTVMEKHLDKLTNTMRDGQRIVQDAFIRGDKKFKGVEYTTARNRWISELDGQLFNSRKIRNLITLGDHPKLKKALGISTKSLAHHWKKVGVGDIPGYARHIDAMAKATQYMKRGGYVAIGLGFVSSLSDILEVCTEGFTDKCERIAMTEGGKFIGSTSIGYLAGAVGGQLAPRLCAVIGFNPVGRTLCAGIGIGAGAWGGGELGGRGGEHLGELIYKGDFI